MSLGSKLKHFFWSKRFLKNFAILIGVYIVVIFGTIWYLDISTDHGEKIKVPNLIGKNEKSIKTLVEDLGLTYEVVETVYDPTKVAGTIVSQDPMATDSTMVSVKEGRVIRIKVTKRSQLVEVPQCIDKSQRFAENILRSRGLKYKVEFKASTEANGAVIEQYYNGKKVKEKERVPIGSTIRIVVGRNLGGEAFPIPDLTGSTICDVKSRLSNVGGINLVIVCDGCKTSSDTCNAIVDVQTPEFLEGAFAPAGSTITVFADMEND